MGGPTVGKLSELQENDAAAFLPESADSAQVAERHEMFVPTDAVPAIFTVDNVAGEDDLADIQQFTTDVQSRTLVGGPEERSVREVLTGDAQVVPSEDGEAALWTRRAGGGPDGGTRARGVFWPAKPRFRGEDFGEQETLVAVEQRSGVWGRVARAVGEHPRRTWISAALGLLVLAAFLPTFNTDGTSEQDVFLTEIDSGQGFDVLEEHFDAGQTSPMPVLVEQADAEAALEAVSGVDGVAEAYLLTPSIAEGAPPGAVPGESPIVVDGEVEIVAISQVAASSSEAPGIVADVRDALVAAAPGAIVGGQAAESLDTQITSDRDLGIIIPSVLFVIFVVLVALGVDYSITSAGIVLAATFAALAGAHQGLAAAYLWKTPVGADSLRLWGHDHHPRLICRDPRARAGSGGVRTGPRARREAESPGPSACMRPATRRTGRPGPSGRDTSGAGRNRRRRAGAHAGSAQRRGERDHRSRGLAGT